MQGLRGCEPLHARIPRKQVHYRRCLPFHPPPFACAVTAAGAVTGALARAGARAEVVEFLEIYAACVPKFSVPPPIQLGAVKRAAPQSGRVWHNLTIRSQKLRGRKSADLRLEPNNLIQNPRPPCARNGQGMIQRLPYDGSSTASTKRIPRSNDQGLLCPPLKGLSLADNGSHNHDMS